MVNSKLWSLHEEVEGQFRWDGQRDLRRYLELCKKHDMPVIIRMNGDVVEIKEVEIVPEYKLSIKF